MSEIEQGAGAPSEAEPEGDTQTLHPSTPTRIDPELLVLRGAPRRVTRFRKQAIIGLACLGTVIIGQVAWLALRKPGHSSTVAEAQDASPAKTTSEVLAGAPQTYGDVPRLGPPLPGDLGRPILDHQQALGTTVTPSDTAAQQAAVAARQSLAAQRKSALESGIMMQIPDEGRTAATSVSPVPSNAPTPAVPAVQASSPADSATNHLSLDPEHDPGNQQRKVDFLAAKDMGGDANPHELTRPSSPYTLTAGTILAASLITGVNSDLPGLVVAQVTENAYDTATGRILLIPQGSRLIGSYDSVVAYGQKRALLVWQRIILPDGSSVRIDNVPASDMSGYAGLADQVDAHTWQLLKGVALSTMLSVGTQLSFGSDESDLLRALRQSTQQSVSQAGNQIVSHALNIQSTITVRPGWPLRVIVHKDIVMRPSAQQGR